MSFEILAGIVAFAALIVTWVLIPTHPEPQTKPAAIQPTA